jgi:hypothetical protein
MRWLLLSGLLVLSGCATYTNTGCPSANAACQLWRAF